MSGNCPRRIGLFERNEYDTDMKLDLTKEQHRDLGIDLNNLTWKLLEHDGRTESENERMVNAAHASAYHWSVGGTAVNAARADWLVSHVYAVLGRAFSALHYAELCYEVRTEPELRDFDLAYAEEAMARAHACSGNLTAAREYYIKAKEAGDAIVDPEDRRIFQSDFRTGPWFGLLESET